MEETINDVENQPMVQVFQTPILVLAAVVTSRLENAGIPVHLCKTGEQYTIEVPAEHLEEAIELTGPDPGGSACAACS